MLIEHFNDQKHCREYLLTSPFWRSCELEGEDMERSRRTEAVPCDRTQRRGLRRVRKWGGRRRRRWRRWIARWMRGPNGETKTKSVFADGGCEPQKVKMERGIKMAGCGGGMTIHFNLISIIYSPFAISFFFLFLGSF